MDNQIWINMAGIQLGFMLIFATAAIMATRPINRKEKFRILLLSFIWPIAFYNPDWSKHYIVHDRFN